MQKGDNVKNEARDILDESEEMWIEEIGNDYIPQNKVISNVILGVNNRLFGMNDGMVLSDDKTFLAYKNEWYFEVFNLPNFTLVFDLEISELSGDSKFLLFSPDSSYLLWNSVTSCISLRERKVVPFIPYGPNNIDCCSFSSCGMKLVTFEKNFVKVWDLKRKNILVQAEIKVNVEHCLHSECNLYILARPGREMKAFDFYDIAILRAVSLKRLDYDKICCGGSCLDCNDNYQIISPSRYDVLSYSAKFRICHFHLPSGGIFLIVNRFCSKPFVWKDRKCVIYFISFHTVAVYDYIFREVVELFYINCLPGNNHVNDITHLEGANFFVSLDHNHAFVLSLETPISSSLSHFQFFNAGDIKCHAISPDNLYFACCKENRVLSIRRINDGKIIQVILIERPDPEVCWWSQMYLWVVCKNVVVKYPYDSAKVLKNPLEDCSLNFKKVLKFMNGVLVACLGDDNEAAIYKICNQTLCPQQIPSLNFSASSAAISQDGSAVLLYSETSSVYQFWEIACENIWELRTTGKLSDFYTVAWFSLTGGKDSRSSIWVKYMFTSWEEDLNEPLCVSSIDFPQGKEGFWHELSSINHLGSVAIEGNYLCSNILIIHRSSWLHFVDISGGSIITSLYIGDFRFAGHRSSFYIPSQRMLVLIGLSEVKFLKIHNIESHLLGLVED